MSQQALFGPDSPAQNSTCWLEIMTKNNNKKPLCRRIEPYTRKGNKDPSEDVPDRVNKRSHVRNGPPPS
jgi:hypothetical protein